MPLFFDNPYVIIPFVLVITAFIAIVFSKIFRTRSKRVYKQKGEFLLSPGEKKFFDALLEVVGNDKYVCPKVRIADFVEVSIPQSDKSFWKYFNKISQKHVDFLICKRSDFAPLVVIELDGGSHNSKSQIKRDEFVNQVFDQSNLPIIHIKPSNFYDYKKLRQQLTNAIQK